MLYVISIIIALFIFIYDMIKIPFILLLIGLIIYILIKEIKMKKYSRNLFKKNKKVTSIDLALMVINEMNEYKKIIINDNNIVLISRNGIYFIKVLDYTDEIIGDINEPHLFHKLGNKKYKIKNELFRYNKEYNYYKGKIKYDINKYIVIRNDCILNVRNIRNTEIIKNKNLYYKLDKKINKYSENEIDEIYYSLTM